MTEKVAGRGNTTSKGGNRASNTPTGTVTFLFTDIEGSTSMWENYPTQMHEALARHDEILRAAVEARGGYVFKTVGDAFCAAFDTAKEALEAALSAQRALFAERWKEGAVVRARMALHTGVAEERNGDYFGPPVNRVARLLSAGHGGQVLLSAVTYGLVRDVLGHMEPEAGLRDLGEHRLRDLRYTEHVYQLVVPDLPKEFPELKTHGLVTPAHGIGATDPTPPPNAGGTIPTADHQAPPTASPQKTPTTPSNPPADPGEERYERKRVMGSGGMAEVYLAHDKVLERDVALKLLRREYADDKQFIERFEREARNAASLSHPNIVAVHDRGQSREGSYYMVMECVPGGTLNEHIQSKGPLRPVEAIELTLQVARALEAAHRRGVIHRDIKPQNILLTEGREAKVADFGIARAASSSTMTKTGAVLGTAHYISPEQVVGQPATPQSDLYSLGVVLYEMLTGELPHDAETPMGIAMKHVSGQLRPPKEVNPKVPEGVNDVAVRLLAKDPKDRYHDTAELIGHLERVRSELNPRRDALTVLDDPGGSATTTQVPDLTGQILLQARSTLAGVNLTLGSPNEVPSDTVTKGKILRQEPPAGTTAEQGSSVSVTVSSGPRQDPPTNSGSNRRLLILAAVVGVVLLLVGSTAALAYVAFGGLSLEPPSSTPSPSSAPTPSPAPSSRKETADSEEKLRTAVEDYYEAVDRQDWNYAYDNLDSETKKNYTRDEYVQKNQYLAGVDPVAQSSPVIDSEISKSSPVEVRVNQTFNSGATKSRITYFIWEDDAWKHRFSQQDDAIFLPDASYDEFVRAKKSGSS